MISHFGTLQKVRLIGLLTGISVGCGPIVATPMPEPPGATIDTSKVSPKSDMMMVTWPAWAVIHGSAGAVTPSAVVEVIDLERTEPAIATTAGSDGSFNVNVMVNGDGDELRFQVITTTERGGPRDMRLGNGATTLTAVIRPACVVLTPDYQLNFGQSGAAAMNLVLNGTCTNPVPIDNARFRQALGDFTFETALPVTLDSTGSVSLQIGFTPTASGSHEDVVFFDAVIDTQTVRYPISLYGVAP